MRKAWVGMGSLALALALPLLLPAGAQSQEAADQLKKLEPSYRSANGCKAPAAAPSARAMPLIDGLAKVHFPLSSASTEAQRYFDQGLALLYGFEYDKAQRSFARGSALDPNCAMCRWGEALALGPYQNSGPADPAKIAKARGLVEQALASGRLNSLERSLSEALAARYAPAPPTDDELAVHGVAFAEALARLAAAHASNDIVQVLAGQAAMEVRPWDYWQADRRTPLPWAARALKLIETVLARNPDQPQAQHLYIHLTEASLQPGKAERAADMLEVAAPASAHLVHMPSHTFYRVGRFDAAIRANKRAIEVDDAMASRLGEAKPFYGYFRHHTHFIVSAAEQRGDAATALAGAAQLEAASGVHPRGPVFAQVLLATALQARAQFGTAADLLKLPEPHAGQPVLRQVWRALRAEALAREGRIAEARQEIFRMRRERMRDKPEEDALPLIRIADHMAIGRINFATGNYRGAATRFARAAEADAALPYREPPAWHQPPEAALGAALLKAGDARGAKAAFERALLRRPGNAWAMWGRAQAEAALGQDNSATLAELDKRWAGDRKWLVLERL
jgi:tetratricopeptide (TPR) repeat protein